MSAKYNSLESRTALVTGASRGIGRACCKMLAATGVSVIAHYNNSKDAALELVGEITAEGGKAVALQAELTDSSSVKELARRSRQEFGHIDILVNNAGEMTHSTVVEMSEEMWDEAQDLHLKSVFLLCKELAPSMMERKWGRIINVSSQVVYTGSNKHAHYSAAKSGLLGLSFSLVKELGSYGITVNMVSPGRIVTDMIIPHIPSRKEEWMKQTPLARFGEPEEVAGAVVFLASGEAAYITGSNIHVNGGLVMG